MPRTSSPPPDPVGQAFQQALNEWRDGPTGVFARAQQLLRALANLFGKSAPPEQN